MTIANLLDSPPMGTNLILQERGESPCLRAVPLDGTGTDIETNNGIVNKVREIYTRFCEKGICIPSKGNHSKNCLQDLKERIAKNGSPYLSLNAEESEEERIQEYYSRFCVPPKGDHEVYTRFCEKGVCVPSKGEHSEKCLQDLKEKRERIAKYKTLVKEDSDLGSYDVDCDEYCDPSVVLGLGHSKECKRKSSEKFNKAFRINSPTFNHKTPSPKPEDSPSFFLMLLSVPLTIILLGGGIVVVSFLIFL